MGSFLRACLGLQVGGKLEVFSKKVGMWCAGTIRSLPADDLGAISSGFKSCPSPSLTKNTPPSGYVAIHYLASICPAFWLIFSGTFGAVEVTYRVADGSVLSQL